MNTVFFVSTDATKRADVSCDALWLAIADNDGKPLPYLHPELGLGTIYYPRFLGAMRQD